MKRDPLDAAAVEAATVARAIQPLLAGRSPEVQSAVLADLVAMWLAGHLFLDGADATALREEFLAMFVDAVRKLIPINEDIIRGQLHRHR
jgi:hypothetical protein